MPSKCIPVPESRFAIVLMKRSQTIYSGMKARAKKGYADVPFTLDEFREWLSVKFGNDGEARCEYSGEMILVENFSVDHRIPISRCGSFALENLALCTEKQNLRKGNMTRDEFRRLKEYIDIYLPHEVQTAIWRKLEVGDVQRFRHFQRQRKLGRG